jgi:acetoin utilization deacetylase AcuC-like enzyme
VDALACDRLGRLALTHEGLRRRDRLVFSLCRQNNIPIVVTLGGGYGNPVDATVEAHADTYRAALDIFGKER